MFYRDIRLDTLFETGYIDKSLEAAGLIRARDYPDSELLLARYKKKLNKILSRSFPFSYGETYSQCIMIDENNHYQMAWNIASAKKVIKRYNVPVTGLSIRNLITMVDQNCINRSHLEAALENNTPVIVAMYPPLNIETKFFIIDGNHRVFARFEAGQEEIPAYALPPDKHLKALIGEGYKLLYKIHYNYYLLVRYIGGIITKEMLEQYLYPL